MKRIFTALYCLWFGHKFRYIDKDNFWDMRRKCKNCGKIINEEL